MYISSITGADSTLFTLGNKTVALAGSPTRYRFSLSDVANLVSGSSEIMVTAVIVEKMEAEGIPLEFRREQTRALPVSIL